MQNSLPLLNSYLVTKPSSLTGEKHTFLFWMREEQWREIQPFLRNGLADRRRIADILPDHSPEEHEFLLSGTTRAERRSDKNLIAKD